jgi:GNAT superfamily N-acetyltransferase
MTTAIDCPSAVEGERARLRRFDGQVLDADWLDEAAQAIAGRAAPCRLQDRLNEGDQGWWILGDGEIVGALCGKLAGLNDSTGGRVLIWTWLAIDARWRAYGYGGASVPLLERAAQDLGARVALTPLPPDNGVALYFWLRLGYTPLRSVPVEQTDWPSGVAPDALWMQRPLEDTNSKDLPSREE